MGRLAAWVRDVARRVRGWWTATRAPGRFLCDSCRLDYGDACRRAERPNATRCDDYRPR